MRLGHGPVEGVVAVGKVFELVDDRLRALAERRRRTADREGEVDRQPRGVQCRPEHQQQQHDPQAEGRAHDEHYIKLGPTSARRNRTRLDEPPNGRYN